MRSGTHENQQPEHLDQGSCEYGYLGNGRAFEKTGHGHEEHDILVSQRKSVSTFMALLLAEIHHPQAASNERHLKRQDSRRVEDTAAHG